ncbi:hypothetical protein F2P81_011195 [Scophthalmus maximus]|uniref:Uncharacterized protein n=1 Tax=Scophthalmus maximus TaxID=52904 RepID=A0A6A4SPI8_SCOMX|nr:hypothetical protein F2P81_011195 [Scophthalmus maximus]
MDATHQGAMRRDADSVPAVFNTFTGEQGQVASTERRRVPGLTVSAQKWKSQSAGARSHWKEKKSNPLGSESTDTNCAGVED